ncbi:MAG TPA: BrnT family toxin [Bryobacteraceae bacterium]|nr:BrnT family toxin [Bryobacteraceae bacterium]
MGNITFAWDRRKARSNLLKHGVSFEEAQTVFLDENARLIDDPDRSEVEDRFLLLGYSIQARCLIVSHCYWESDSVIRLISARRATTQEEQVYWRLK